MEEVEKIAFLRKLLDPEVVGDEELKNLLFISKNAILNRRYPQGYDSTLEVPHQYEHIQLQACVNLYNKKGVEGQTSHTENGIARVYEPGDISESLLSKIMPMIGSVMKNENIRKK